MHAYEINRGYQMSVGLILNLMYNLNRRILFQPLANILFYSTSSINLVLNLHNFNMLFIKYPQKILLTVKYNHFYWHAENVKIMFSTLFMLFVLHKWCDIKCYYTSVILFLLNGFITLLHSMLVGYTAIASK